MPLSVTAASRRAGPDAPPAATVVVLNRDGRQHLDICLPSVLSQDVEGGLEVVLVDNASRDGSVEHVRAAYPAVRIVDNRVNLGFSGGNNAGIAAARGRHVILLNNDTRVRDGWAAALVSAADSAERVGAVTSKSVFMDRPNVIQNAGSLLLSDGSGADRGFGEVDNGQYDEPQEIAAACGNGVLLTRPMLEDVGLLDESFFAYYEDTDLSWRMRLRGWRILYEPSAVLEHRHAATNAQGSSFFVFHANRGRLFMLIKNAPAGFAVRAAAGLGLRLLRRRGSGGPSWSAGVGWAVHVKVVGSLLAHLPEMLLKRRRVRGRRTVPDSAILSGLYPRALWDEHGRP